MIRLILFFIFAFIVSFLCVGVIKILVVYMAEIFYGGHYKWGMDDIHYILMRGGIMGLVFCVLGTIRFILMNK